MLPPAVNLVIYQRQIKIIDPSPEVKTPSLRDLIKGQESIGIKKIETDWQEYIVA